MRLDNSILDRFRKQAHAGGGASYQALINNDPPAEPEALRLLAPQRGLRAVFCGARSQRAGADTLSALPRSECLTAKHRTR